MPRTQVLMTKELFNRFKKVPFGSTDGKPHEEQKVLAKFFNPTGIGTWYITEFDGDDTLYGLCCLQEKELGYVSLKELQTTVVRFNLGIERDIHWDPNTTMADVLAGRKS